MTPQDSQKIRVLVVDDSSVMRRIITTVLAKHPDIELAGYAVNGLQAIEKVRELRPDVVTLDIEMPEMDGLAALKQIRKENRLLPIIMCSSLTHANSQATVMALSAGASDYVGKPTSASGLGPGGTTEAALQVMEAELLPKIVGLARRRRLSRAARPDAAPLAERAALAAASRQPTASCASSAPSIVLAAPPLVPLPVAAVVIGVSTGGPMALLEIFSQLSAPVPVPVFIVQHMPASFTKLLAARLAAATVMDFKEPVHGEAPLPGVGYLAPGGQHMALVQTAGRTSIVLNSDPPENSCRPAVDVLFRSAAEVYGSSLLAVVLTGMGYDGLKGCQVIRSRHGRVIAQDEESSVVWGMPGAVAQNQLAEMVLPLGKFAEELAFRTRKISGPRRND
jgi:two-component system chemotaxis response regulator CheB